jgi:PPOX class probable F420-dependent enzyme
MIPPTKFLDLLEEPLCGVLSVVTPDGKPHSSVIWRLYEAPYIVFSSLLDSQKYRHIQANPNVELLMVDYSSLGYRYLIVRGSVTTITPDPMGDMIDRISLFYENMPYYGGSEPLEDKGKKPHVTYQMTVTQYIGH